MCFNRQKDLPADRYMGYFQGAVCTGQWICLTGSDNDERVLTKCQHPFTEYCVVMTFLAGRISPG